MKVTRRKKASRRRRLVQLGLAAAQTLARLVGAPEVLMRRMEWSSKEQVARANPSRNQQLLRALNPL